MCEAREEVLSVWFSITIFGLAIAGFLGQPRPVRLPLGVQLGGGRGDPKIVIENHTESRSLLHKRVGTC